MRLGAHRDVTVMTKKNRKCDKMLFTDVLNYSKTADLNESAPHAESFFVKSSKV